VLWRKARRQEQTLQTRIEGDDDDEFAGVASVELTGKLFHLKEATNSKV